MQQPISQPEHWTEADYLNRPEGERWEVIDGIPYPIDEGLGFRYDQPLAMSPAPSIRHQEISSELNRLLGNFFRGKPCKVLSAPLDVKLGEQPLVTVQPDILVVCDASKLTENRCEGAPDLVIEIVSPASVRQDYVRKLNLYEKYGVKEYWIVHPIDQTVMVFFLQGEKYGRPDTLAPPQMLVSHLFPGLQVDLNDLFGE